VRTNHRHEGLASRVRRERKQTLLDDSRRKPAPTRVDRRYGASARARSQDRNAVRRDDAHALAGPRADDRVGLLGLDCTGLVGAGNDRPVHLHGARDVVARRRAPHAEAVLDAERFEQRVPERGGAHGIASRSR
jgi:hypothetical protein